MRLDYDRIAASMTGSKVGRVLMAATGLSGGAAFQEHCRLLNAALDRVREKRFRRRELWQWSQPRRLYLRDEGRRLQLWRWEKESRAANAKRAAEMATEFAVALRREARRELQRHFRRIAQSLLRRLGYVRETTSESGSNYYRGTRRGELKSRRIRISDHVIPLTEERQWNWENGRCPFDGQVLLHECETLADLLIQVHSAL